MDQRVGREDDGREERCAQETAAHFFENDGEFDIAVAAAAELLGNDQRLEAHLFGHLLPNGFVIARLGFHQPANLGLWAFRRHELVHDLTELFLLF